MTVDDLVPSPTSVAARYLDVAIAHPDNPSPWRFLRTLGTWVAAMLGAWDEPISPCSVVIQQRSDGRTLVTYRYLNQRDAANHLVSLRDRLAHTHITTMCRDLGIDFSTLAAPGDPEGR